MTHPQPSPALSDDVVAQMVADLTHTDGPDGEMSMLYRGVIADALTTLAAENATLRASEAAAQGRVAEWQQARKACIASSITQEQLARLAAAEAALALTPTADKEPT